MGVSITYPGDLPNLNDPTTFNVRALTFFAWVAGEDPGELLGELADMDAADFFDVQSSPTDAGAGKVLLNKAHGLGETDTITAPLSLDTITVTGFHRYASTTTSAPSSAGVVLHMTRLASSTAGGFIQIAFSIDGEVYLRRIGPGSVWTTWSRVFSHTSILGAVSQSGGVPTGAIIETGTNANGTYTKWADGTMIVTKALTGLGPINLASGGQFLSPSAVAIGALAATFVAPPLRIMSPRHQSSFWVYSTFARPTASDGGNCTLGRLSTSADTAFEVDFVFVGRWF